MALVAISGPDLERGVTWPRSAHGPRLKGTVPSAVPDRMRFPFLDPPMVRTPSGVLPGVVVRTVPVRGRARVRGTGPVAGRSPRLVPSHALRVDALVQGAARPVPRPRGADRRGRLRPRLRGPPRVLRVRRVAVAVPRGRGSRRVVVPSALGRRDGTGGPRSDQLPRTGGRRSGRLVVRLVDEGGTARAPRNARP